MMDRWRDKVAVVTGASAGIGAAIVEQLVRSGLKVVGLARRQERLNEMTEKLEGHNGSFVGRKVDVTIEDDILSAFQWIEENVGPVSILINNAGVGRMTTIINGDIAEWRKVLDTNILGMAIASREALKSMQDNNIDGHIININSIAGHVVPPVPFQNLYPASKHAVTAFTETLRRELVEIKSKIKVSSLSPGVVETDIFAVNGFLECKEVSDILSKAPRLQPNDIAEAVIYMLATPPHVQVAELIIKPVGEYV